MKRLLLALFSAIVGSAAAAEYVDQGNLAQIGVTPELHDVADGTGAVILVLDTPIYQPNSDLIGKAFYFVTNPYPAPSYTTDPNANWHGTAVAVTAAGRRDGAGLVGVAPGAGVLGVSVFNTANAYVSDQGNKKALDWSKGNPNVFAVNRSFGAVNYENPFGSAAELNVLDDYSTRYLIVQAAMNDSKQRMFALYSGNVLTGLGHIIIAGAVDENNVIAPWSNKPGQGCITTVNTDNCSAYRKIMNWYLVAPADGIALAMNNQLGSGWGTSFAAPQIAGAATLVWQDARNKGVTLSPSEVRGILFSSATDLGAPGIDGVYGNGLLNVAAALQPIGLRSLPVVPGQIVYDRFRRPFRLNPIPAPLAPTVAAWSAMMGGETMQVQWKDNVSLYSRQALIDDTAALTMTGVQVKIPESSLSLGISAGALHETYSALGMASMTPTTTTLTGLDASWRGLSVFYMRGETMGYRADSYGFRFALSQAISLDMVKPLSIVSVPSAATPWAAQISAKWSF